MITKAFSFCSGLKNSPALFFFVLPYLFTRNLLQKSRSKCSGFSLDEVHFCQVFGKTVDGLLHLLLRPGGRYAMPGDDCWYIHKIAFKQFYNNA